jgi:hypothetical protein
MPADITQESAVLKPTAQGNRSLHRVFAQIDAHSCPKEYNFHLHTIHSDGRLRPQKVIEQAIAIGLRGLAITDHHSVDGYRAARCWLDARRQPTQTALPTLWSGVEINALLLGTEVHILGYDFDPDHASLQPYLQGETVADERLYPAHQVIGAIQQAGGIAVLAHPARYRKPPDILIPEAARLGINGVETYYAYANPDPWQPTPRQTRVVWQLGNALNLFHTCGTDTHGENLLQRL